MPLRKMCKQSKVVRPKDIGTPTTRLLKEDITRIVEGLKSVMVEEHTTLVVGVKQEINMQKRIQQEYVEHFTKPCQVLKETCNMTSPHGPIPTCTTSGENT